MTFAVFVALAFGVVVIWSLWVIAARLSRIYRVLEALTNMYANQPSRE